jgi:hypothetical protein
MLEIRVVGNDGALVRTIEDVTTPSLPVAIAPRAVILADYCFNEEGPWVNPKRFVRPRDVAAVVYNRHGKIESMTVGECKLHDEEVMSRAMGVLRHCLLTKYSGKEGKEIFMFYLAPHIKKKMEKMWSDLK